MFWARLGTQSFVQDVPQSPKEIMSKEQVAEQRLSSESVESGVDPMQKTPVNVEETQANTKLGEEESKPPEADGGIEENPGEPPSSVEPTTADTEEEVGADAVHEKRVDPAMEQGQHTEVEEKQH